LFLFDNQEAQERGVGALVLFLYLCASTPPVPQLLKQNHYLQSIGPLIQLPSTEVKILSKALIARLIPSDVASDDTAVMILLEDEEVAYLVNLVAPVQSSRAFPITSVMLDLSRSPHNLFALASSDVTLKLSDTMESLNEESQAEAAQLIWRMMELEYDGSEAVSTIINNGTLQMQSDGKQHHSYNFSRSTCLSAPVLHVPTFLHWCMVII